MDITRQAVLATLTAASLAATANAASDDELRRATLAREVEQMMLDTAAYTGKSRLDTAVIEAIRRVPRHAFVPAMFRDEAYANRPLPIGAGQTISQPYIVALMTDLARVDRDARVLEIGTGSGYQAAVLAEIVAEVYTIEIIDSLGRQAAATLEQLGYDNVSVKIGDGYLGWPEFAPFDAIVVTAAPETVPAPLIEQLAPGGRLVVPVGPDGGSQSLKVIEKSADGKITKRDVLPVRFVPFTRD